MEETILKPVPGLKGFLCDTDNMVVYKCKKGVIRPLTPIGFYKKLSLYSEGKTNNKVSNLEWCTHQYNSSYGNRNRKISKTLSCTQPSKRKIQNNNGDVFNSIADAARCVNGAAGNIVKCLKQQTKTAYGYKWKYVD